jgi:hypothetical protein
MNEDDPAYNLMRIHRASKLNSPADESIVSSTNLASKANLLEVLMNDGKKTTSKMMEKMQNDEDAFYN